MEESDITQPTYNARKVISHPFASVVLGPESVEPELKEVQAGVSNRTGLRIFYSVVLPPDFDTLAVDMAEEFCK